MTLKQQQTIDEQIKPYWYDEKQLIKEQTLVSEYEYNDYTIELKQQQFYFMNEPDNIGTYRTYVRIYCVVTCVYWFICVFFGSSVSHSRRKTTSVSITSNRRTRNLNKLPV